MLRVPLTGAEVMGLSDRDEGLSEITGIPLGFEPIGMAFLSLLYFLADCWPGGTSSVGYRIFEVSRIYARLSSAASLGAELP